MHRHVSLKGPLLTTSPITFATEHDILKGANKILEAVAKELGFKDYKQVCESVGRHMQARYLERCIRFNDDINSEGADDGSG